MTAPPGRRSERDTGSGNIPVRGRPAAYEGSRQPPSHSQRRAANDDPLTSPSFPRVPVDDSRSYRRERGETNPGIPAVSAAPAASASGYSTGEWSSQATAAYPRPAASASSYLSAPIGPYPPSAPAANGGYPAPGRADHQMDSYPMPASPASVPRQSGYSPDSLTASYSSPQAGAGYPNPPAPPSSAGFAPLPPPPAAPGGSGYGHDSASYSSASTAGFPVSSDARGASQGYPAFGSTGPVGAATSGQHARPLGDPYAPPSYSPPVSGQSGYSGQFSYPVREPALGHPEPARYASPYDAGGYVQAGQPFGGYASDPYTMDAYGYPDYRGLTGFTSARAGERRDIGGP